MIDATLAGYLSTAENALSNLRDAAANMIPAPAIPPRKQPSGPYWMLGLDSDLAAAEKLLAAYPGFGLAITTRWGRTNPRRWSWDFSRVLQAADICARQNRTLWWRDEVKAFNSALPRNDVCPAEFPAFQHKVDGWQAPLHEPDCLAAYLDYLAQAAYHVGSHPAFVAYDLSESAIGPLGEQTLGFRDGMTSAWLAIYSTAGKLFTAQTAYACVNFFDGHEADLIAAAKAAGLGHSSTDSFDTPGNASTLIAGMLRIAQVSQAALTDPKRGRSLADNLAWLKAGNVAAYSVPSWLGSPYAPADIVAAVAAVVQ